MGLMASLKRSAASLLVPVLAVSAAAPALAQDGFPMSPGEFFIGGVRAICGEVETLIVQESDELIFSPNNYTLAINGPRFDALPIGVRLFVYYQTCGMMGYQVIPNGVQLADAYAARRGVGERWLSADDIQAICETTLVIDAGWSGAPDAARCAAIYDVMIRAAT